MFVMKEFFRERDLSNLNPILKGFLSVFIAVSILLLFIPCIIEAGTFTVINTNDSGMGSLRNAINTANGVPGKDTILFAIPGAGVQTILPDSQYAPLVDTAGVFIDGLSQAGSSTGSNPPSTCTLMVEIDGMNAGYSHGLWIFSPNNTVQGLIINNFEKDGIRIQGKLGGGTYNNLIYANFIGTDPTGTAPVGNGRVPSNFWAGVDIIVTPDTAGFAFLNSVEKNLISANYAQGVSISNCPPGDVHGNMVYQNYIGTDISGTVDIGNINDGVYIGEGAHDNTIDTNLISGNDYDGVCIVGYMEAGIYTNSNVIIRNLIGLDVNLNPLPNKLDGICIGKYGDTVYYGGYAEYNVIDGNTIAHNGHDGICIWEHPVNFLNADHNLITRNSVYHNDSLGIDLGDNFVTLNDGGDPDAGANEEMNFPIIQSAVYSAGQTVIAGTLDVNVSPPTVIIEIFRAITDSSGYGEGAVYLSWTSPDSNGKWVDTISGLSVGDTVTSTAGDQNMNSSEFSPVLIVTPSGLDDNSEDIPSLYKLGNNFPNPFTGITSIEFAVPKRSEVRLRIYDCSGREVRRLIHGVIDQGRYSTRWDGRDNYGNNVSSGIYIYSLESGNFKACKKMVYVK